MTQKLIIPHELPALNQTIEAGKRHWSEYAVLKRRYTALVAALARRQLRPVLSGRVQLSFAWYCRDRRKDPDNIASAKKFIIDGLVAAWYSSLACQLRIDLSVTPQASPISIWV